MNGGHDTTLSSLLTEDERTRQRYMTTGAGGFRRSSRVARCPPPGGRDTNISAAVPCLFSGDSGREGAAFLMVLLAGLECFSLGGGHSRSFIMLYYNVFMRLEDMRSAIPATGNLNWSSQQQSGWVPIAALSICCIYTLRI